MHPNTEGVCTRLGWVFFDNNVVTPLGYWYNIPASLLHDRKLTHPIMFGNTGTSSLEEMSSSL